MKKKIQDNKTKYIHYGCIILFLFVMMLLPLGFDSIFGSKTDWIGQHTTFADYFRMLFYNTGDLFPDYAFHIVKRLELDDSKLENYYDIVRNNKLVDDIQDMIEDYKIFYENSYKKIK